MDADILKVNNLNAGYGRVAVLRDINITARAGQVVSVLGANGAGKTTLLRAISGLATVSGGRIAVDGRSVLGVSPERTVKFGVAHVPQGRGTFRQLTVRENLMVSTAGRNPDPRADVDKWLKRFPRLLERQDQRAGTLSGGEQQMLAVARGLMSRPKLLLLDEPSMGLAPNTSAALFDQLRDIARDEEVSIVLVEQNAGLALAIAEHAYILESGRITISGPADGLLLDDRVRRAYLRV